MSAINGNFSSGLNPSQMMQEMSNKFKTADTDGNETVSKQEFDHAMDESGLDTNKMFNRMDSNGDGEVSHQEHQDMMSFMEQRMESMMGKGGVNKENFDVVQTLIESIQNESDNDDDKQRLQEVLEKMRSEGYNESTMSESLSLINEVIPRINTSA